MDWAEERQMNQEDVMKMDPEAEEMTMGQTMAQQVEVENLEVSEWGHQVL